MSAVKSMVMLSPPCCQSREGKEVAVKGEEEKWPPSLICGHNFSRGPCTPGPDGKHRKGRNHPYLGQTE